MTLKKSLFPELGVADFTFKVSGNVLVDHQVVTFQTVHRLELAAADFAFVPNGKVKPEIGDC